MVPGSEGIVGIQTDDALADTVIIITVIIVMTCSLPFKGRCNRRSFSSSLRGSRMGRSVRGKH